jgi:hypothetical protein
MADCLFCKMAAGEIPVTPLKRSADAFAIQDINPQAPTHVLVIPLRHIAAVRDAKGPEGEQLLGRLLTFTAQLATELGLVSDCHQHGTGRRAKRGSSASSSARGTEDEVAAGVSARPRPATRRR